jgi:hypothetical protein
MKSFRDPITNVLRAWGHVDANGDDLARDEPDDFNLKPGKWQLVDGEWVAAVPTFAQLVGANTAAIQAELDRRARENGYDNIVSACSYAAQAAGEPFQAEGAAYLKWRSDVWSHAYAVLAEVEAGTRAMPTPAEAVAEMPALVLP